MRTLLKVYILFGFVLILCSCQRSVTISESDKSHWYLEQRWIYATAVTNNVPENGLITRPLGSWQLLLKVDLWPSSEFKKATHCLYYRVPYKNIRGALLVVEQTQSFTCAEIPAEDEVLHLPEIENLKYSFETNRLELKFTRVNQEHAWSFIFPNTLAGVVHQKYRPQALKKWRSHLTLLPPQEESPLGESEFYIGKLHDRFSTGTAKACRKINKDCEVVGEDSCERCRYGWYEVIDYQCPQGGSRYCGQNHCGQKNEPACLRGTRVVDASERGICESDLTAVRRADQILLCQ